MTLEFKEYKRTVGTKQAKRAVANDEAKSVIIAKDADKHVINELIDMCEEKNVEIIYVETMARTFTCFIGKATKIRISHIRMTMY